MNIRITEIDTADLLKLATTVHTEAYQVETIGETDEIMCQYCNAKTPYIGDDTPPLYHVPGCVAWRAAEWVGRLTDGG